MDTIRRVSARYSSPAPAPICRPGSDRGTAAFLALLVASVALTLSAPAPAAAQQQECGDWYRPMVCTAELVATGTDFRATRLSERSRVEMEPREQITLEVNARDQNGRRFPVQSMALSYNDFRCDSVLQVEDLGEARLRLNAAAAQGRCTLEVWLPNNLNFAWEIEVLIDVPERTSGYDRSEAITIAQALYQATLNREPDTAGYTAAVNEIQRGSLQAQVESMTRSPEFRQVIEGMSAEQVLAQFYRGVFNREPDSEGARLYLDELRRGRYATVLLALVRSPEFELRLRQR